MGVGLEGGGGARGERTEVGVGLEGGGLEERGPRWEWG